MAKKKIKDITKKKELPEKETKKVKGGSLKSLPTMSPVPEPTPMCFCSSLCSVVGRVFGSEHRSVEAY